MSSWKTVLEGKTGTPQVKVKKGAPRVRIVRKVALVKTKFGKRCAVSVSRVGTKKVEGVIFMAPEVKATVRKLVGKTCRFSRDERKSGVNVAVKA